MLILSFSQFYADLLSHHPSTLPSDSFFGKIAFSQANLGYKTMREVGAAEWNQVEELLRGVLTS